MGDSEEGGGRQRERRGGEGRDANFRDKCVPTLIWNNPFRFPPMMNGAGNNSHSRPPLQSLCTLSVVAGLGPRVIPVSEAVSVGDQ